MTEEKSNFKTEDIIIKGNGKKYLLEMAKWSNFLSIFSFIMVGLVFLFLVYVLLATMNYRGAGEELLIMVPSGILLMVIYFFPAFYLQKFLINIRKGIYNNDSSQTEEGLMNLKSFFKFFGIFLIVYLSLIVLSLLLGLIAAFVG